MVWFRLKIKPVMTITKTMTMDAVLSVKLKLGMNAQPNNPANASSSMMLIHLSSVMCYESFLIIRPKYLL